MIDAEAEPTIFDCRIASVEPLNSDVHHIRLHCDAANRGSFLAGQYLQIITPGSEPCAFSIASTPKQWSEQGDIELHFRVQPDNPGSDAFLKLIQTESTLQASLPFGHCRVEEIPQQSIMLIAGSTGYAQVRSILLHLLENQFERGIHLYWGGRLATDLYLEAEARSIADKYRQVSFHSVLSEKHSAPPEDMRDGWLHQAILEDFDDLTPFSILVSGSPGMVYSVYDSLKPHGANRENFFSDVFEYAPRPGD